MLQVIEYLTSLTTIRDGKSNFDLVACRADQNGGIHGEFNRSNECKSLKTIKASPTFMEQENKVIN